MEAIESDKEAKRMLKSLEKKIYTKNSSLSRNQKRQQDAYKSILDFTNESWTLSWQKKGSLKSLQISTIHRTKFFKR